MPASPARSAAQESPGSAALATRPDDEASEASEGSVWSACLEGTDGRFIRRAGNTAGWRAEADAALVGEELMALGRREQTREASGRTGSPGQGCREGSRE